MATITPQDRTYTLIGLILALFLGALDQTIVSTALPKIVEDLGGLTRYAWVATAYLLASTVTVPIYGKLADIISRKHIELFAVVVFLLGSFLCGLSGEFGTLPLLGDGMQQLIIFRAIQGLGGAGLFAMTFIIIGDLFPPAVRGKYLGFVGAAFGVSSIAGPLIGGLLTDYGGAIIPGIEGWRWVFYVNVPFGALALWFIITRMPVLKPDESEGTLDVVSAGTLLLGLVPLVLVLQLNKTVFLWDSLTSLSLFGLSALGLVIFIWRSLTIPSPILELRLFKDKVFAYGNAASFFIGATFLSMLTFLPLFMVQVVGVSATQAGISLMPLSLGVVFGSVVAGQLISFLGYYRPLMIGAGCLLLIGMFFLANMPIDIAYWQVMLIMVICGIGLGPNFPLYTIAIQNAVPANKLGQATSSVQFFRQIGAAIGVAFMGTVLTIGLSQGALSSLPQAPENTPQEAQVSEGPATQLDPESIAKAVQNAQISLIERAFSDDPEALAVIEADSRLITFLPRIQEVSTLSSEAQQHALAAIKADLATHTPALIQSITQSIRHAFASAITRIYFYAVFLVIFALIFTCFIPEKPLRTSNT